MDGVPARGRERRQTPLSPLGMLLALVSAGGVSGAITLLYRGMAVIMVTEGGFVASGGPYEIAHPAPDWAWLVPLSIMAMMAFGGLGIWVSFRGWGVNLVLFAWMGLFLALGWNFIRFGLIDPPEGLQGAWGWILSGVVFWALGLAPSLAAARTVRDGCNAVRHGQPFSGPGMFGISGGEVLSAVYLLAQLSGVVAGVAGGLALFAATTGV